MLCLHGTYFHETHPCDSALSLEHILVDSHCICFVSVWEFLLNDVGQKYVMINVGVFIHNSLSKCVSDSVFARTQPLVTHPCLHKLVSARASLWEGNLSLNIESMCQIRKTNIDYRNSHMIHYEIIDFLWSRSVCKTIRSIWKDFYHYDKTHLSCNVVVFYMAVFLRLLK